MEAQPPKAKRAAKAKAPKAPKAAKPPPGPAWDPSMRPPPLAEGTKACRILSWNVAGLRVGAHTHSPALPCPALPCTALPCPALPCPAPNWAPRPCCWLPAKGRRPPHPTAPWALAPRSVSGQFPPLALALAPALGLSPSPPLQALLKKVKEVEAGARQEHIPTPLALADAEQADVLCLQVRCPGLPALLCDCTAFFLLPAAAALQEPLPVSPGRLHADLWAPAHFPPLSPACLPARLPACLPALCRRSSCRRSTAPMC